MNVFHNNGVRSYNATVADGDPWHNHCPTSNPDVVADGHRLKFLIALKSHWHIDVAVCMVSRVDYNLWPDHYVVAGGAGTENLTINTNTRVIT